MQVNQWIMRVTQWLYFGTGFSMAGRSTEIGNESPVEVRKGYHIFGHMTCGDIP